MKNDGGQRRRTFDISVGIPAYGRSGELGELLGSIYQQTLLPAEVTICEDASSERERIRSIVSKWRKQFESEGCAVNYKENARNLGYDGNIRNVIGASRSQWVMLIGNDDLLLKDCIEREEEFFRANAQIKLSSRTFVRFEKDIERPIGISRLSARDEIYSLGASSPRMIFRSSGFVGGLVVNREWAQGIATDRYDGTLYYQVYLAAMAFCEGGIGYIAHPTVGGRSGNPPLFGSAKSEKGVHVPGSFTPKGRAKMWASVLQITREVGEKHNVDLYTGTKGELEVRQSFHVFEMMAGRDRSQLRELREELRNLDLFNHPIPRALYLVDWMLGSRAKIFYALVRKLMQ
ncbi:MAG: glycosyltransferase [Acidobacteriaceae bacterium]|jgi:glycosyltransferase involved in cell wall biosynthesis